VNSYELAADILNKVFDWFSSVHGMSFDSANADLGINTTPVGLVEVYGSG
jgi:hypothetical protein